MKMMKPVGALVAGAALAAAVATASAAPAASASSTAGMAQAGGTGATAPPAPAAPPPAMAAPPRPNPALDQVKYFAGDWQCSGTGYVEGKAHPTTGKVHMAWDLNGFFLGLRYEEQKTDANPMPITAVEHWGYSDELKKLVTGGVDSMGGYFTESTVGWEGDRMVWSGTAHMAGMAIPARDTFVRKSENEVTHLGELQQNGAWVKLDEETCLRLAMK